MMKINTFTLLFALIYSVGFAQKSNVFHIDSLPKKGILLDKGWKWNAGNNVSYSEINFDDSKWDTINIQRPINKLKQITDAQLVWFRLTLEIDSSVTKIPLFLVTSQMGASELYFDGILIRKLGVVSSNSSNEVIQSRTFGVPSSIIFNKPGKHVLAVKYSFSKKNYLLPFSVNGKSKTLSIWISNPESFHERVVSGYTYRTTYYMSLFGFFLMMCIFQFILYLFDKKVRVNLIFAVALLFDALHFLFAFVAFNTNNPLLSEYYQIIGDVTVGIYFVLLGYTICVYLQRPLTKIFWTLVVLFFSSVLFSTTDFRNNLIYYVVDTAIFVLMFLEVIRQIIKAKKVHRRDASTLLISIGVMATAFVLRNVLGPIVETYFGAETGRNVANSFMILCYITIPITLCILIAKSNILTKKILEIKLEEIEKLSNEKQHILSTQNEYLEKQVDERTAKLNQSLSELKATQAQLIQSEKLASLGELTAGIAHEIQNPLNFVNNFSELSEELIDEMNEEIDNGNLKEVKVISGDLKQNLEKINHHGKRASSIVKGMLEHSRTSTGLKELTDINALADEYLRLSYHGLRAKDKSFNSDFKTDFDENLPKIEVIPQDFGRVLLNIINNAFYACAERSRSAVKDVPNLQGVGHLGKVLVTTQQSDNQIIIKVKDNGIGMSESTKAKIFQPFFTTKPTGQGTGLGLSLAYDIITKGHNGTLEVESTEGEGTTFTIILPLK